jgi:thiol-disulfide isomerase/thioredoxin
MRTIRIALAAAFVFASLAAGTAAAQTAPLAPLKPGPVQAEDIGFAPVAPRVIETPAFTDAYVAGLLTTLDSLVNKQTDAEKWAKDANLHFWRLMNRLQLGRLSASQEATVLAHFDTLEKSHPKDKAFLDVQRRMVREQMIGKIAPEIVGKDLDGVEFKLSEYRGKVTVLYFTGEWCGPCRGEYPYERLMLEVHKDAPFAIVSVNSDSKVEVAQKSKVDNKLNFRTWWDGYLEKNTSGPIATAWNVTGWPAIYVLDAKGVIRFAHLRIEDVLKGVSQLLSEHRAAEAAAKKK